MENQPSRRSLTSILGLTAVALATSRGAGATEDAGSAATGEIVLASRAAAAKYRASEAARGLGIRLLGWGRPADGGGAFYRSVESRPPHPGAFQTADGGWWEIAASILNVHQFGATGDGVTEDSFSINAAGLCAEALGVGLIEALPGKVYRVTKPLNPGRNRIWDFKGSAIESQENIGVWTDTSPDTLTLVGTVTANVEGTTSRLQMDKVTGLEPGDWVGVRLGDNPWDGPEPRYAFAAQVLRVSEHSIEVDHIISHKIAVLTAKPHNRVVFKLRGNPINLVWRNLEIRCPHITPGVDGGFFLRWGVNLRFENVNGNLSGSGDMGCGLFGLFQFCRDVYISAPRLYSNQNKRKHPAGGRMFNFSNCINVVIDAPASRNLEGPVGFFESYCEGITVREPHCEINADIARPRNSVWFIGGGSEIRLLGPVVITSGPRLGAFYDSGGTDHTISIEGTLKWRGPMPSAFFSDARVMHGVLDWADGDQFVVVDYAAACWRIRPVMATTRATIVEIFAPGPAIEAYICATAAVSPSSYGSLKLGWGGTVGWFDGRSSIKPGFAQFFRSWGAGADWGGFNQLTQMTKLSLSLADHSHPPKGVVGCFLRTAAVLKSSAPPQALTDGQIVELLGEV